MSITAEDMENVPLFAGLSDDDRGRVGGWFEERTVAEGSRFTNEGASGYVFFVILEGTAEVKVDDRRVGGLAPGDFFGEIAMLADTGRRMAEVVATSPMRVGTLFGTGFRRMEVEFPLVAERLQAAMNERLANAGPG